MGGAGTGGWWAKQMLSGVYWSAPATALCSTEAEPRWHLVTGVYSLFFCFGGQLVSSVDLGWAGLHVELDLFC